MIYRASQFVACLALVSVVGCSSGNYPQAEQAANEMVALMEEMVSALESVKSPADADQAAARIDAVTAKFQALVNNVKDLKITKSENDKLEAIIATKTATLESRMEAAAVSAGMKSEGASSIIDALQRFQVAASQMQFAG
jgi:hypothetical protein